MLSVTQSISGSRLLKEQLISMLELVSGFQFPVLCLIPLIDQTDFHIYRYCGVFCFFKFATYWLTVCVAGDTFTGDDIQLSADVNIICAEAILTLVNKD